MDYFPGVRSQGQYYSNFTSIALTEPTHDTRVLIQAAYEALEKIYRPGVGYKKSGLMLGELTGSRDVKQFDLLDLGVVQEESKTIGREASRSPELVLKAIDALNQKYGQNTVSVGKVPKKTTKGQGRRNHTSPQYTTRWTDLPKV